MFARTSDPSHRLLLQLSGVLFTVDWFASGATLGFRGSADSMVGSLWPRLECLRVSNLCLEERGTGTHRKEALRHSLQGEGGGGFGLHVKVPGEAQQLLDPPELALHKVFRLSTKICPTSPPPLSLHSTPPAPTTLGPRQEYRCHSLPGGGGRGGFGLHVKVPGESGNSTKAIQQVTFSSPLKT